MSNFIEDVLNNMPADWLNLTTHRLDIYDEKLAKIQFLERFEALYNADNSTSAALSELPTAYDYIRLGHPLSCILEWSIAKIYHLDAKNIISFSSQTIPLLAILRKNLLSGKKSVIYYKGELPEFFDTEIVHRVYGYTFELLKINEVDEISESAENNGSIIYISQQDQFAANNIKANIDFYINLHPNLGSVLIVNEEQNEAYVSEIQHVRRRETIAMTPANSLTALQLLIGKSEDVNSTNDLASHKSLVEDAIRKIAGVDSKPLIASSGLSIQYAILMGLIHDAVEQHNGKAIKIVVPPNCYGGTNDQARRVAACIQNVEVVDLPVDGDDDMVQSIDIVLGEIAQQDAVPYIIAEIPTNPRVEVPNLANLNEVLSRERVTKVGNNAIKPVFILDQTFCPNFQFLAHRDILSEVKTISFASGSKFPSGGKCTAGYCIGNSNTEPLIEKIEMHLKLCDNEATDLQYEILAKQMPTMTQRIIDAYKNTREFVDFVHDTLPTSKINFVSEALAEQGFTPSVFSLDLPTKGNTDEEREAHKRTLNLKLIHLMITEIPEESKFCVSYGQLKGCYWTIPATSTQGTTKEGDKDYIVRASLSPTLDLERHKRVFKKFVDSI